MPIEYEVKIAGDNETLKAVLAAAGARVTRPRMLEDNVFLDTADGELRRAGELLRLRRVGDQAWLTYKYPGPEIDLVKARTEHESRVGDADEMLEILARLGFVVSRRYQKYRTSYFLAGVEVCLDETPAGCFLELEGEPEAIDRVASRLGFDTQLYDRRDYLEIYRDSGGTGDMMFSLQGPEDA